MHRGLQLSKPWTRHLHSTAARRLAASSVESAQPTSGGHTDIRAFQEKAFIPKRPLFFSKESGSPGSSLPAAVKWFGSDAANEAASADRRAPSRGFSAYMAGFNDWPFPYELVSASDEKKKSISGFRDWLLASQNATDQVLAGILQPALAGSRDQSFFQLYAPLQLLAKALEFNYTRASEPSQMLELYIAQSSLSDLPPQLQDDLPTPELVLKAGKGDIYSSSVWLGTQPTYTPLHRDPNPNLFCQLCSRKVLRLMPPSVGDRLFFEVQAQIRQQGNSRIRTADMMQGKERQALHAAVWENESPSHEFYEAEVAPGDALFVPAGWWHSVKSVEANGQLNGSVNWWFR